MNFRSGILTIVPRWLQGYWGSRLLYAIGIQLDALSDAAVAGVKARFASKTPVDGLPIVGAERGIRRGFNESSTSYAARCSQWLDDRKRKGNPWALMRQLQGYLTGHRVPMRVVNQAGVWCSLDADGVADFHYPSPRHWDWDADDDSWSRYWVILYPPSTLWDTEGEWRADAYWGDGGTWGSTMTVEQAKTLKAIVAEWNPPHARCEWIIVAFDPTSFEPTSASSQPDGTWGHWGVDVGGTRVSARLSTARYMRGPV